MNIHPIQTGSVQVKQAQRERRTGGLLRVLLDPSWTDWLPISCWVIEHPEGVIVGDTGNPPELQKLTTFPSGTPTTAVRFACK